MSSSADRLFSWPALDVAGGGLPSHLTYERGIWGKLDGAPSDYRWLAATPNFAAPQRGLQNDLALGPADAGDARGVLWRTIGDTSYAVAFYPSRAHDAAGRSGFLEQQVIEWKRSEDVPAALGALLLLPLAAAQKDSDWWDRQEEFRWFDTDEMLDLHAADPLPVAAAVGSRIRDGQRELTAAVSQDAVADLYAALLAGGRGISLQGLTEPLSPAAVAALLLPLPRAIADRISIAGWLPSSWLSDGTAERVRECWDLVLGGATPLEGSAVEPTLEEVARGRAMAGALYSAVAETIEPVSTTPERRETAAKPLQLTLWGPSAAGKTVFLAKLFLDADQDENGGAPHWGVFPTAASASFFQKMRETMEKSNSFPPATTEIEGVEYVFSHTSGARAALHLEDRAGSDSEKLPQTLLERLGSADGLVLLFDLMADQRILEERIARTVERVHLTSGQIGRKDQRPIAVCISKADRLLATGEDYRQAVSFTDDFIRDKVPRSVLRPFDRFCSNYRVFPISAIGVRPRYGLLEPAVFVDEALQERICPGARPLNLMAPFIWLLHELTGLS